MQNTTHSCTHCSPQWFSTGLKVHHGRVDQPIASPSHSTQPIEDFNPSSPTDSLSNGTLCDCCVWTSPDTRKRNKTATNLTFFYTFHSLIILVSDSSNDIISGSFFYARWRATFSHSALFWASFNLKNKSVAEAASSLLLYLVPIFSIIFKVSLRC